MRLPHTSQGTFWCMDAPSLQSLLDLPFDPEREPVKFLRHLHSKRLCDREIAECLNDPAQYLFHKHSLKVATPLHLLEKPDPPVRWTRRMVQWTRHKLGLVGHRKARRDIRSPGKSREVSRKAYAARWVTLKLDLYPSQVDILNTLHEFGPQTMYQIMQQTGRCKWPRLPDGSSAVSRLVEAGVVNITGDVAENGRVVRQFALASGVHPRHNKRRLTSVDQRYRSLGLIEDPSGGLPSVTTCTYNSDLGNFFSDDN